MSQTDTDERGADVQPSRQGIPQTLEEAHRTSRIIYLAMIAGLVVVTALMLGIRYATQVNAQLPGSAGLVLGGVCVLMMIAAVSMGFFLHRKQLRDNIDPETGESTPMAAHAAIVLRGSMIEGPSLFGAICALLVHPAMVAVSAIGLILLLATFPKLKRAGDEYARNPYDPNQQ